MASARESICQNDPNFAVICSFLNRYGDLLGIPKISFAELQTYLEETKYVSDVLIDLHVRLLRKLGKTSANFEKWERCVTKFCYAYSGMDGWEMEELGYAKVSLNTRLRILKNLLEAQFDSNNRFKDKINDIDAADLRFLPIGRDKNGLAYWYLLDEDFNLRVYKEEQDDEDAESWQLVCSNRNELADLIAKLQSGDDIPQDKDKLSTTSGDSDGKDEEFASTPKVKLEVEEEEEEEEEDVKIKPVRDDGKEQHLVTKAEVSINTEEAKVSQEGGVKVKVKKELKEEDLESAAIILVRSDVSVKEYSESTDTKGEPEAPKSSGTLQGASSQDSGTERTEHVPRIQNVCDPSKESLNKASQELNKDSLPAVKSRLEKGDNHVTVDVSQEDPSRVRLHVQSDVRVLLNREEIAAETDKSSAFSTEKECQNMSESSGKDSCETKTVDKSSKKSTESITSDDQSCKGGETSESPQLSSSIQTVAKSVEEKEHSVSSVSDDNCTSTKKQETSGKSHTSVEDMNVTSSKSLSVDKSENVVAKIDSRETERSVKDDTVEPETFLQKTGGKCSENSISEGKESPLQEEKSEDITSASSVLEDDSCGKKSSSDNKEKMHESLHESGSTAHHETPVPDTGLKISEQLSTKSHSEHVSAETTECEDISKTEHRKEDKDEKFSEEKSPQKDGELSVLQSKSTSKGVCSFSETKSLKKSKPEIEGKDVASGDKDVTSADKDKTPGDKHVASGDKDVSSADKDITSGDRHVASGDKDVSSADKDITSGDRHVASGDKDVSSADKDITSGDKHVASGDKDVSSADKDITSGDKHVASGDTDVSSADKDVASGDKHVGSQVFTKEDKVSDEACDQHPKSEELKDTGQGSFTGEQVVQNEYSHAAVERAENYEAKESCEKLVKDKRSVSAAETEKHSGNGCERGEETVDDSASKGICKEPFPSETEDSSSGVQLVSDDSKVTKEELSPKAAVEDKAVSGEETAKVRDLGGIETASEKEEMRETVIEDKGVSSCVVGSESVIERETDKSETTVSGKGEGDVRKKTKESGIKAEEMESTAVETTTTSGKIKENAAEKEAVVSKTQCDSTQAEAKEGEMEAMKTDGNTPQKDTAEDKADIPEKLGVDFTNVNDECVTVEEDVKQADSTKFGEQKDKSVDIGEKSTCKADDASKKSRRTVEKNDTVEFKEERKVEDSETDEQQNERDTEKHEVVKEPNKMEEKGSKNDEDGRYKVEDSKIVEKETAIVQDEGSRSIQEEKGEILEDKKCAKEDNKKIHGVKEEEVCQTGRIEEKDESEAENESVGEAETKALEQKDVSVGNKDSNLQVKKIAGESAEERKAPEEERKTLEERKKVPETERKTCEEGRKTPDEGKKTFEEGRKIPEAERKTSEEGGEMPEEEKNTSQEGRKTPEEERKTSEDHQGEILKEAEQSAESRQETEENKKHQDGCEENTIVEKAECSNNIKNDKSTCALEQPEKHKKAGNETSKIEISTNETPEKEKQEKETYEKGEPRKVKSEVKLEGKVEHSGEGDAGDKTQATSEKLAEQGTKPETKGEKKEVSVDTSSVNQTSFKDKEPTKKVMTESESGDKGEEKVEAGDKQEPFVSAKSSMPKAAPKRKSARASTMEKSLRQKVARGNDSSETESKESAVSCSKDGSVTEAKSMKKARSADASKEDDVSEPSKAEDETKDDEHEKVKSTDMTSENLRPTRKQKLQVREENQGEDVDTPGETPEKPTRSLRTRTTRSRGARGGRGGTRGAGRGGSRGGGRGGQAASRAAKRQVPAESSEQSSQESDDEPVVKQARRGRARGRGRGRNRGNSRRSRAKKVAEDSDDSDDDLPLSRISMPSKTRGSRGKSRGGRGRAKGAKDKPTVDLTPVRKSSRPRKRKKVESDEEFQVKQTRGKGRGGARRGRQRRLATSEEDTDREQEEEEERLVFEALEASDSSEELTFHYSSSDSPVEELDEEYAPQKKGRNARRAAARSGQKNESQSEVDDDTPCCKCLKFNQPEWILLCDKCDAGYHTACLRPPLMIIPEGDWFCPPCQHKMLVERLTENLKELDTALKKYERLLKRKERLAYVGISLDNIVKEERKENVAPEYLDYEYDVKPKKKHHSSSRPKEEEVFLQRTCRARTSVSYQFKEYDELINSAIQDDIKEPPPPGISRGKDMYNIEEAESKPSPVSKKRKKRRLTGLDEDFEDDEDDSEEYKATDDSEMTPAEEEEEDDDVSSSGDSGRWRSIRTRRFGKPTRKSSRKGGRWTRYDADFVVDDDYESEGSDNCRRSTRSATKRRVCYRESNSEESEAVMTPSDDYSSDDSRPSKQKKRLKIQKQKAKPKKRKGVLYSDESEEEAEETEEEEEESDTSTGSNSGTSDVDSGPVSRPKMKKKRIIDSNNSENSSDSQTERKTKLRHSRRASAKKVNYNKLLESDSGEDTEEVKESKTEAKEKFSVKNFMKDKESDSEDSKNEEKSDENSEEAEKEDSKDSLKPKPRGIKITAETVASGVERTNSPEEFVADPKICDSEKSESPKVSNSSSNGNSIEEAGLTQEPTPPNGHRFDQYTPQMPPPFPHGYGYDTNQYQYYPNSQADTYQPQGYFPPPPQGNMSYRGPTGPPHPGMPHLEQGAHYTGVHGMGDQRPGHPGMGVPDGMRSPPRDIGLHRPQGVPPPSHRGHMMPPYPDHRDQRMLPHQGPPDPRYQELQPPNGGPPRSGMPPHAGYMRPSGPHPGMDPSQRGMYPPGPEGRHHGRMPGEHAPPRGSFMMDSILRPKGYGEGDDDDLSDVSDLISYVTQDT